MPLVAADAGMLAALGIRLNNSWPAGGRDLTLRLFVNDVVPADTNTAATYTEAAGGGYSAKTLSNGSWTIAIASGIATATYADQLFSFSGPLTTNTTVYGYYVTDADGVLQWAEKFVTSGGAAAPFVPTGSGSPLTITPRYQQSKGTPS